MNIGWCTNGELDYERLTLLGDNGWRIPLVKEFIRRGHRVQWLSVKPHLARDPEILEGLDDFYWVWRTHPAYPGHHASDYFAHIIATYAKEIKEFLPKLDIFFFEPRNHCVDQIVHQLMLLHYYCQQPETVIMVMDADAVFLMNAMESFVGGPTSQALMEEVRKRVVLMYPSFDLPDSFRKDYPNIEPMFVFYQKHKTFEPWPNPSPKYDISYIGNDYDRREMFERFFSKAIPISDEERRARKSFNRGKDWPDKKPLFDIEPTLGYELNLWGKWDEEYLKQPHFSDVNFHGPLDQTMVSMVYYNTLCCLNVNRPMYSATGFTVDRMSEVLQNGCILLLNDDWYGGEKVVGFKDLLVHDKSDLVEKIKWIRSLSVEARRTIVEKQLSLFQEYDEVKRVGMMLEYYVKYVGVLNSSSFDIPCGLMEGVGNWNSETEAKVIAEKFNEKKAGMVDRKKDRLKGNA